MPYGQTFSMIDTGQYAPLTPYPHFLQNSSLLVIVQNNSTLTIHNSTLITTPHSSPLTFHDSLLPARRQNVLNLLRLLIDRLIPGETGLLGELRHRLDELIDLRAEQRVSVAGLDRFCTVP